PAARERPDRAPSASKRMRAWSEDHGRAKRAASEENRVRPDAHHPRASPPPHRPTSPAPRRSPPDARRAHDGYHPSSEASHRPPSLPSLKHAPYAPLPATVPEERREDPEPAARPMDVDEDYDDDGGGGAAAVDDEPRHASASAGPGRSTAADRPSPPSTNGVNGGSGGSARNGLANGVPNPVEA
ncbi:MAG: hypothetical protein M1826_005549, partial [Phylliscum demangeonii]